MDLNHFFQWPWDSSHCVIPVFQWIMSTTISEIEPKSVISYIYLNRMIASMQKEGF